MAETKRETVQKDSANHGEVVTPTRELSPSGWLRCPENKGAYDGENRPWLR